MSSSYEMSCESSISVRQGIPIILIENEEPPVTSMFKRNTVDMYVLSKQIEDIRNREVHDMET